MLAFSAASLSWLRRVVSMPAGELSQRKGTPVVPLLLTVMIVRPDPCPGSGSPRTASHSWGSSEPSSFTGKDRSWPDQSPLLNFAWYTRVSSEIEPQFTEAEEADPERDRISLNALVSCSPRRSAFVTRK